MDNGDLVKALPTIDSNQCDKCYFSGFETDDQCEHCDYEHHYRLSSASVYELSVLRKQNIALAIKIDTLNSILEIKDLEISELKNHKS